MLNAYLKVYHYAESIAMKSRFQGQRKLYYIRYKKYRFLIYALLSCRN